MNILITILISIIALLMLVIGSLFVVGARDPAERKRAIWFLVAMLGGALWSLSSGMQLLFGSQNDIISLQLSYGICCGSLISGIGLLGYCVPYSKIGKAILIVLSQLSLILILIPLFNLALLNNPIYNYVNWFYIIYSILILVIFAASVISAIMDATIKLNKKDGDNVILFLVGLSTTVIISIVFNMIFPVVFHINNFLWIGPISVYILVLTFYFKLFANYKINVNSGWLKMASYFMIVCSAGILYSVIVGIASIIFFYDNFSSVTLSIFVAVISLALVIIIVTVYKISASVRSLLSTNNVDIAYVIKQINNWSEKPDYKQIAIFLKEHLHISYCGVLINKKLYESQHIGILEDDLMKIEKLDSSKTSIWQNTNLKLSYKLLELNLSGIAQLKTEEGFVIGQILVGKPNTQSRLSRKDSLIFEMLFNLIAEHINPMKINRK